MSGYKYEPVTPAEAAALLTEAGNPQFAMQCTGAGVDYTSVEYRGEHGKFTVTEELDDATGTAPLLAASARMARTLADIDQPREAYSGWVPVFVEATMLDSARALLEGVASEQAEAGNEDDAETYRLFAGSMRPVLPALPPQYVRLTGSEPERLTIAGPRGLLVSVGADGLRASYPRPLGGGGRTVPRWVGERTVMREPVNPPVDASLYLLAHWTVQAHEATKAAVRATMAP
jgi:hypothetical protein